jgi:enoyl-[acyl-carrier-protein] reductase (NADH)
MLRPVTPADVGNIAVLYAADLANMVTGETVIIDGGMNILIAAADPHPRAAACAAPPPA